MKTEKEIRARIEKIKEDYGYVLNLWPASVAINAPRALMQITEKTKLDVLYWTLGENRPILKCDDFSKLDQ